ncbi:MAG: hypothetical protein IJ758_01240 [Clostridia bacterium]|nr:hypothetical protein [Clostridia bacterium]
MKGKKNKSNKNNSDVEKLKSLSKILMQYNLTAVEILENEKKYRVEKNLEVPANTSAEGTPQASVDKELDTLQVEIDQAKSKEKSLEIIASTMVGIFHDRHSDEKSPLIKIGQKFEVGDVLCIIEAMKTFTEVRADVSGVIKEICVKNGDLVEYSQPIFKYVKQ